MTVEVIVTAIIGTNTSEVIVTGPNETVVLDTTQAQVVRESQITEVVTAGQVGPPGPIGPQGAQGAQGAQGMPYTLWDTYETVEELLADEPTDSGVYGLINSTTNDNGKQYYWDGTEWVLVSNLSGPQGAQGAQGAQGVAGDSAVAVNLQGTVALLADLPETGVAASAPVPGVPIAVART